MSSNTEAERQINTWSRLMRESWWPDLKRPGSLIRLMILGSMALGAAGGAAVLVKEVTRAIDWDQVANRLGINIPPSHETSINTVDPATQTILGLKSPTATVTDTAPATPRPTKTERPPTATKTATETKLPPTSTLKPPQKHTPPPPTLPPASSTAVNIEPTTDPFAGWIPDANGSGVLLSPYSSVINPVCLDPKYEFVGFDNFSSAPDSEVDAIDIHAPPDKFVYRCSILGNRVAVRVRDR